MHQVKLSECPPSGLAVAAMPLEGAEPRGGMVIANALPLPQD